MKKIRLYLLMLLAAMIAMPLSVSAKGEGALKDWSEGHILWDDFQGVTVLEGAPSFIKAYLAIDAQELSEGAVAKKQYRLSARAIMDMSASYAAEGQRTHLRLRYHQLQFDALEYYRRRMQKELNAGVSGLEAENRLRHYQNLFVERCDRINKTTENGTNDNRMQEEEYLIRKQLDEMGLPEVPVITAGDFCYGVYAGIGGIFPSGGIQDNFSNCVSFTLGLTGGYKRFKLKSDISFGQPNFNRDNIFGVMHDKLVDKPGQANANSFATYLGIGTSLGFTVLDTKRIAITPNIGGSWNSYGWKVNNLDYERNPENNEWMYKVISTEKKSLNDFSWMASIDFDIKIHKNVSDTPFFLSGHREEFLSSIRVSPFVTNARFTNLTPSAEGYIFGVTVSYLGLARTLKLK